MMHREGTTPEGLAAGEIVAAERGLRVRVGQDVVGEGVLLREGVDGVYG